MADEYDVMLVGFQMEIELAIIAAMQGYVLRTPTNVTMPTVISIDSLERLVNDVAKTLVVDWTHPFPVHSFRQGTQTKKTFPFEDRYGIRSA